MENQSFLRGKTLLLTGGGRATLENGDCGSIGYGIATAYAKEGANLVITGRNVQKLQDAKEEAGAALRHPGPAGAGGCGRRGRQRSRHAEGRPAGHGDLWPH